MAVQLVIAKGKMNIWSVHTPQTGCTDEENDNFWKKLDEVLQSIPANEKVILAGDMNIHVGADRSGVGRWHGGHGYGSHNEEGRTIQLWMSTIDYIMVRRDEIRTIEDCKVIPGECVATQHRLVVM